MQEDFENHIITGVLLDVSGSMKDSVGQEQFGFQRQWARSIFTVINNLINHDVGDNNEIFSIAFGGLIKDYQSFNLLSVMEVIRNNPDINSYIDNSQNYNELYEKYLHNNAQMTQQVFQYLARNGAGNIRGWTTVNQVNNMIQYKDRVKLFQYLLYDENFRNKFIFDYLPKLCRNRRGAVAGFSRQNPIKTNIALTAVSILTLGLGSGLLAANLALQNTDTRQQIQKVKQRAFDYILKNQYNKIKKEIFQKSDHLKVYKAKQAYQIIHQLNQKDMKISQQFTQLDEQKLKKLLKNVDKFIYGNTPFWTAFSKALSIFQSQKYKNYKKVLFIVSDGMPSGKQQKSIIGYQDITIICCYITNKKNIKSQSFYGQQKYQWQQGAKLMFNLSSSINTRHIPKSIFLKKQWNMQQNEHNEVKLFINANHPDNIKSICQLTKNLIYSQQALSEFIFDIDLDLYINQNIKQQKLKQGIEKQQGGTCYAHAISFLIYFNTLSVKGRQGGYPCLQDIRKSLIKQYEGKGFNSFIVIKKQCPNYRLQQKPYMNFEQVKKAISNKRPVFTRFVLKQSQWKVFKQFYQSNKNGILTKQIMQKAMPQNYYKKGDVGHAVVLVSYCKDYLLFMNSWGTDWGCGGFFKVKNNDVLKFTYIDIFWDKTNLTQKQKQYYKINSPQISKNLMKRLKSLSSATIKCPKCQKQSLVTSFTGTVAQVQCPMKECCNKFSTKGHNIIALSIYLNSINNNNQKN